MPKKAKIPFKELQELFPIVCDKLKKRYKYLRKRNEEIVDGNYIDAEYLLPLTFGEIRIIIAITALVAPYMALACTVCLSAETHKDRRLIDFIDYPDNKTTFVLKDKNKVDDFVEQIHKRILKCAKHLKEIGEAFLKDAKKLETI